ncbi:MAG: cell division protein [Salibacteraceae bacterium]
MPIIQLETSIKAPIERCFHLSRSIDLHKVSTAQTGERAIAGVTSGLVGMGESVTWRARHFGVWQNLTSKVTAFDPPFSFVDEMQQGAFQRFWHQHRFENREGTTIMTDVFDYTAPLGPLGKLADGLFLKSYMTRLLVERNNVIREFAETDRWREVLPASEA